MRATFGEKAFCVVPLQSISKTNLLLPLVAKSKLSKLTIEKTVKIVYIQ